MKRLFGALLAALVMVGPAMVRTVPAGAESPDAAVVSGTTSYSSARGLTAGVSHSFTMNGISVSGPSHLSVASPCTMSGTSVDSVAQGSASGTMNCWGVAAPIIWVRVGVVIVVQWNPPPPPYNFAFVMVCVEVAESDPTGTLYRYECVGAGA